MARPVGAYDSDSLTSIVACEPMAVYNMANKNNWSDDVAHQIIR